jgi:Cupin
MVDDWLAHTPLDIVAKNFGLPQSVFNSIPTKDPYIFQSTVSNEQAGPGPVGTLAGKSSYVFKQSEGGDKPVPGNGGTFRVVDSTNFPIAKNIASAIVTLKPNGLRELHWHPNVSPSRSCWWLQYSWIPRLRNGSTSRTGQVVLPSLWVPQRHGRSTLEVVMLSCFLITLVCEASLLLSAITKRSPNSCPSHQFRRTNELLRPLYRKYFRRRGSELAGALQQRSRGGRLSYPMACAHSSGYCCQHSQDSS